MHSKPYIPATRAEFEAAPVVQRARRQIARLQEVIDHGLNDVARAERIKAILEESVEHAFEYERAWVVRGQLCQLRMTLNEWAVAIDTACVEIDRMERAA